MRMVIRELLFYVSQLLIGIFKFIKINNLKNMP